MKSLAERAAEALPCTYRNDCKLVGKHWFNCPAVFRPAVEAALRELMEECAAFCFTFDSDESAWTVGDRIREHFGPTTPAAPK